MRIAFIAGTRNRKLFRQDPSFIYRCENLGLALQKAGHEVQWLHWTAVRPFESFDVVVFHRPRYSALWYTVFCWLKRQNCVLIADVDDLIFDANLAHYSPGVLNTLVSLAQTQQLFTKNFRALACFDQITVSTQSLVKQVTRLLPTAQVQLLPNAVHHSWRNSAHLPQTTAHHLVLTYFSGTRSHDRDFALYANALAQFLTENLHAQLHITGYLQFKLTARRGQIVHHEKVPFTHYAQRVRHSWLNLAPLEDTPFTQCKSALKIIEAGYWNIPTLCSPFPDALRFEGAGALFAHDEQSCFTQLQTLLQPSNHDKLAHKLSEKVLQHACIEQIMARFLEFITHKQ